MNRINEAILIMVFSSLLTACGGSDSNNEPPTNTAPDTAATLSLSFQPVKTFYFSWNDVSNTTHYKLLENPDGSSGFTQVGEDIPQGTEQYRHIIPLYQRLNAQYILQSCNNVSCIDATPIMVSGTGMLGESIGYFKASNADADDKFGASVALSADGNTLAVGARNEGSAATGINGDEADNSATYTGAVYLFTRSGSTWNQQAYIKASNAGGEFGTSLALSADGNTLAVSAYGEASAATGINGDETDNSATYAGAVYLFTRSSSNWSQQAYIKASNTDASDFFGWSIALSTDGDTLAVGAPGERGATTGINGDETDNSTDYAGAVYLFTRSGSTWSQQAYIKAGNTNADDWFGTSVALSTDGNTLAVGADYEDGAATGINGNEANNNATDAGAVYVFIRNGSSWSQQAYIKASNTDSDDQFGASLDLSHDGNTLVVGAFAESSAGIGINTDETDNSASWAGAVYIFARNDTAWSQQAYLKASNTNANDWFGLSVSLDAEGNILAVGANYEASAATGINGDETDNSAIDAGAVYLFSRSSAMWSQQSYIKASNTDADDLFGQSVVLSASGSTLAVGALDESSAGTGVGASQDDNSTIRAGAVYVY